MPKGYTQLLTRNLRIYMHKAHRTRLSPGRILLVLAVVMLFAAASYAAPTLVIPEDKFDFGFVPQQSQISHDFWLKSIGTDTLKILKVVPG